MEIKLLLKLTLKKLGIGCFWDPGQCFCKKCGSKHSFDFMVDDGIWALIESDIKYGNVLCYNCFCELIMKKTKYSYFKLEGIE